MNLFNPFTITLGLTALVFLGAGWLLINRPPSKINHLYGYRMPSSMSSQERWDFAQKASGVQTIRIGWILAALAFIRVIVPGMGDISDVLLALGVVILACIRIMTRTEQDISERFSADL